MNGHVLQTLREQLKVPGSRLEGSELLTSEFLRFRSRLNETSGGLGKIGAVSGSDKHTISTLLIKPIFSVLAHAEKQFFSKLVFECSYNQPQSSLYILPTT